MSFKCKYLGSRIISFPPPVKQCLASYSMSCMIKSLRHFTLSFLMTSSDLQSYRYFFYQVHTSDTYIKYFMLGFLVILFNRVLSNALHFTYFDSAKSQRICGSTTISFSNKSQSNSSAIIELLLLQCHDFRKLLFTLSIYIYKI